jgi:hypothetical protein
MEQKFDSTFDVKGAEAEDEMPPGWFTLPVEELPRPTYWPVTMALGIVFLLGGIIISFAVSVVGLALVGTGLAGWLRELHYERHDA